MAVLASDDFNRANGGLGANWTRIAHGSSTWNISSNQVVPDSYNDDTASEYTAVSWPADQYSQCAVSSLNSGDGDQSGLGALLRSDSTGANFYWVIVNGRTTNNVTFAKQVSSSYSMLQQNTVSWTSGDVVRGEVQGSTLRAFKNGASIGTKTDVSLSTGKAGIVYSSLVNTPGAAATDNWQGGDFTTAGPFYSPPSLPVPWDYEFSRGS